MNLDLPGKLEWNVVSARALFKRCGVMPPQFRKNLVTNSEKVLEHSLALLPVSSFLGQVCSLLESETDSVRHDGCFLCSARP